MSIYYGLIIPRSYNDYINKSQPEEFRKAMDNTGLIPNAASEENQLADKNFVNSTVGTNTANYIYKTESGGEKVPFSSIAELEAYTGTVTNNDYAFVTGTDENGNIYFDRYKANVDGDVVTWAKEYRLNNSSFTADQWAAIQSGITAELVEKFNAAAVPAVDKVEAGEMAPVTSNAVNGALANYVKIETISPINRVNDANLAVPSNVDYRLYDTVFHIDYLGANIPPQIANYRIEFKCRYISGGYSNAIQIAYAINSSDPNIYVRYCSIDFSTKIWTFGNWQKLTTESNLNTTLADYIFKPKTPIYNSNTSTDFEYTFTNNHSYLMCNEHGYGFGDCYFITVNLTGANTIIVPICRREEETGSRYAIFTKITNTKYSINPPPNATYYLYDLGVKS